MTSQFDISDQEVIERYGGGYGSDGIVEQVRSYRAQVVNCSLPRAFIFIAKKRGIPFYHPQYDRLRQAVVRELSRCSAAHCLAPAKLTLVADPVYLFQCEVLPIRGKDLPRCEVRETTRGVVITFARGRMGNLLHVGTTGYAAAPLIEAAKRYAESYWN